MTTPTPMAPSTESAAAVPEARSTLTCPLCGHSEELEMPTQSCMFFHECSGCRALLRPKPGHCCVFCSYGTVACPPIQATGSRGCCD